MLVSESASPLTGEEVVKSAGRWIKGRLKEMCTICRKFIQCKSLKKHMISAEHNTNRLAIYAATYEGTRLWTW